MDRSWGSGEFGVVGFDGLAQLVEEGRKRRGDSIPIGNLVETHGFADEAETRGAQSTKKRFDGQIFFVSVEDQTVERRVIAVGSNRVLGGSRV